MKIDIKDTYILHLTLQILEIHRDTIQYNIFNFCWILMHNITLILVVPEIKSDICYPIHVVESGVYGSCKNIFVHMYIEKVV